MFFAIRRSAIRATLLPLCAMLFTGNAMAQNYPSNRSA